MVRTTAIRLWICPLPKPALPNRSPPPLIGLRSNSSIGWWPSSKRTWARSCWARRMSSAGASWPCSRASTCCWKTCRASARRWSARRSPRASPATSAACNSRPTCCPATSSAAPSSTASKSQFIFHRGPIFANIVLADEINRAPPRTQSALLEAMSEGQCSVDGQTLHAAAAVPGHRHAEPVRVRRDLPAAREPARPLPAPHVDGLSRPRGRAPRARQPSPGRAGAGAGARHRVRAGRRPCRKRCARVAVEESVSDYLLDIVAAHAQRRRAARRRQHPRGAEPVPRRRRPWR